MHRVKIYLNLVPENAKDYENEFLLKEKYPEICASLPTPQKASAGAVLKTMWSFNSNKHIIFSTIYRLWLFRRKAFYRRYIPRSISIIHGTAIVRNSTHDVNQRSFLKICLELDGNLHMITLIKEPWLTCSQVYHSDCSILLQSQHTKYY